MWNIRSQLALIAFLALISVSFQICMPLCFISFGHLITYFISVCPNQDGQPNCLICTTENPSCGFCAPTQQVLFASNIFSLIFLQHFCFAISFLRLFVMRG